MSNLIARTLTGIVFISLIIGSLIWDESLSTLVLSLFFVLSVLEFLRLFKDSTIVKPNPLIGGLTLILPYLLLVFVNSQLLPPISTLLILPFLFLVMLSELGRKQEQPLLNLSVYFFGLIYLVVPFFLLIQLHANDYLFHQRESARAIPLVLGMFVLIWTNDTLAYVCGSLFGKHRLIERISPKKSWEGTIGGVLFTFLFAWLISLFTQHDDLIFWLISAAVIAPAAVLGDLFESLIKRSFSIKDSGSLLPGHGGVLDRFDAVLFTSPFFVTWCYLYF